MSVPLEAARTAAKEHRCDAATQCLYGGQVEPGARYLDVAYPPWTKVQEDPEYPPTQLNSWVHYRYHPACISYV